MKSNRNLFQIESNHPKAIGLIRFSVSTRPICTPTSFNKTINNIPHQVRMFDVDRHKIFPPSSFSRIYIEYERRRLENIKRNDGMMASLKIHAKATELFTVTKRQRVGTKKFKITRPKKPKSETPIVIRRSLRTRGISPEYSTKNSIKDEPVASLVKFPKFPTRASRNSRELICFRMRDVYISSSNDGNLIDTIKGMSENAPLTYSSKTKLNGDLDVGSLVLKPENIARVMPERISTVEFFPSNDRSVIVAGNNLGNVAFWDVECEDEEENYGIYLYHPHTGPISGISIQPFSQSKVFTSCLDGFIRFMDVEKESFYLLHSCDDSIFSLSHRPHDANSLYFGGADGELNVLDERTKKPSNSWILHERRINTIDFNPQITNLMATSSSDGTACIWDLRSIDANRPKPLKMVDHKKTVHSAYFSPSGSCLATTSTDNQIGLLNGVDFTDLSMIYLYDQIGWLSYCRAIWGWDDSHIFIGNRGRGVDVISAINREKVKLQSPLLSAIPSRLAAHPYRVGTLAGATGWGKVYIWTSK